MALNEQFKSAEPLNKESHQLDFKEFEGLQAELRDLVETCLDKQTTTKEKFYILDFVRVPISSIFDSKIDFGDTWILPPMVRDGREVALVISKATAKTFLDAVDEAAKRLHQLIAIATLAFGQLFSRDGFSDAPKLVRCHDESNLDSSLYSDKFSEIADCAKTKVDTEALEQFRQMYTAIRQFGENEKTRFLNRLFAHYGAVESMNPTLSMLGLVACMTSLSSHLIEKCPGRCVCDKCDNVVLRHNLTGDRRALAKFVVESLEDEGGIEVAEKHVKDWSKAIYSDHRSEFIHAAKHKFVHYSQDLSSSNSTSESNYPTAMPCESGFVGPQHHFLNDLELAFQVARILLIRDFWETSVKDRPHGRLAIPNFGRRTTVECFVANATNGWLGIINSF